MFAEFLSVFANRKVVGGAHGVLALPVLLPAGLLLAIAAVSSAFGQTMIVSDNYNTTKYEIKIGRRNDAGGTARFSFGLATAEGAVTTWDFGIQMYHAASGNDFCTKSPAVLMFTHGN